MAWKKACMLINLLEPQDLQSKEVLDMLQPSTDVDMTTRQVFQSKTEDIPNFPYTETPILPKEVYRKGLTSKEKLQYLPGMDPIFVVKQPCVLSSQATRLDRATRCVEIHMGSYQWCMDKGRTPCFSTRAGYQI